MCRSPSDADVPGLSSLRESASKGHERITVLIAGVAGLVAGSMSMAVGEYVSVSSQRDAEHADIERETQELAGEPQAELNELAMIYMKRGVARELAMTVAQQLSARNPLGVHMRDELGIDQASLARPFQAAVVIGRWPPWRAAP
jgi:VIT1/CCC1 family predicted Fe2+/Mn2+ transporter